MYGPQRLIEELQALGHTATEQVVPNGLRFAVIPEYTIGVGQFAGREIGLALPATPDFPRTVGASIHVRATPLLLPFGNIQGVRNIIASPLGDEWQYWSHNFNWTGERERSAARLLAQVNAIFSRA